MTGKRDAGEWRTREDSNLWPLPSEDCGQGYESQETRELSGTAGNQYAPDLSYIGGETGAPQTKGNPDALAGAIGVATEFSKFAEPVSQKSRRNAILLNAAPRHRAVAATITAALTLGNDGAAAWAGAPSVFSIRLTDLERIALAFVALCSLEAGQREEVIAYARQCDGPKAGAPLPPLLNVMQDARWWASTATTRELKAYALAAFEALSISDRARFLAYVTGLAENGRAA